MMRGPDGAWSRRLAGWSLPARETLSKPAPMTIARLSRHTGPLAVAALMAFAHLACSSAETPRRPPDKEEDPPPEEQPKRDAAAGPKRPDAGTDAPPASAGEEVGPAAMSLITAPLGTLPQNLRDVGIFPAF